jgi:DNA-binding CsgD family transcriptional regulator
VRSPTATSRQREVLEHLAAGDISKEIAAALGISEAGVKKHLESLRHRYGVTTRAAMIRVAIERGDLLLETPAGHLRSTDVRVQTMNTLSARTATVRSRSNRDI